MLRTHDENVKEFFLAFEGVSTPYVSLIILRVGGNIYEKRLEIYGALEFGTRTLFTLFDEYQVQM